VKEIRARRIDDNNNETLENLIVYKGWYSLRTGERERGSVMEE
jgi:hypothetical protein